MAPRLLGFAAGLVAKPPGLWVREGWSCSSSPIPALASRHSRARRCRASPAVCRDAGPKGREEPGLGSRAGIRSWKVSGIH